MLGNSFTQGVVRHWHRLPQEVPSAKDHWQQGRVGIPHFSSDPWYLECCFLSPFDLVQQAEQFQCGSSYFPVLYNPTHKIPKKRRRRKQEEKKRSCSKCLMMWQKHFLKVKKHTCQFSGELLSLSFTFLRVLSPGANIGKYIRGTGSHFMTRQQPAKFYSDVLMHKMCRLLFHQSQCSKL